MLRILASVNKDGLRLQVNHFTVLNKDCPIHRGHERDQPVGEGQILLEQHLSSPNGRFLRCLLITRKWKRDSDSQDEGLDLADRERCCLPVAPGFKSKFRPSAP